MLNIPKTFYFKNYLVPRLCNLYMNLKERKSTQLDVISNDLIGGRMIDLTTLIVWAYHKV